MSKVIWKYELEIKETQSLMVPKGSQTLCVQMQKDALCLWLRADPDQEKEEIIIEILRTGQPVHDSFKRTYIGTIQIPIADLVWHVFERSRT